MKFQAAQHKLPTASSEIEEKTSTTTTKNYLEKRMSNGLVENWIADASDPLVDKIDDSRLACHDEFLVLCRRLNPISAHGG